MDDENNVSQDPDGEVGYRKPPTATRFKRGQSGNPKGRPKGTQNLGSIFAKSLGERVVINENGKRKTITKLEAATKQLANKAASGDPSALRQLITVVLMLENRSQGAALPAITALDDADQKVVMGILKRLESSVSEKEDK